MGKKFKTVSARFLAIFALIAIAFCAATAQAADAPQENADGKKTLVVYFSRTGHTETVAKMIHDKVGGDIVRIETVDPYPDDYQTTVDLAQKQQREGARPAIKTSVPNIDDYDIIFLGYPNWWSSMPMPVFTFLEQTNLDGKTVAPFATHGGGGLGQSIEHLKKAEPKAKIVRPFSVSATAPDKRRRTWINGWIA